MARLICRPPADHWPTAEQALQSEISAWLIPVQLNAAGVLDLTSLQRWPGDLPYCLEWLLPNPLSPREQRAAIEQLRPWLVHPLQLRWRNSRPLWIAEPKQLSHPHWAQRQLQLVVGADVLLWGRGGGAEAVQGRYGQPLRDWRCRQLDGTKLDYESYLFHAHHRLATDDLVVPAVLPWTPLLEESHANHRPDIYNEWLAQARAWADLRHGLGEEPWVLVECWDGHQRRWMPADSLQATGQFQHRPSLSPSCPGPVAQDSSSSAALVVHGFHIDQLQSLLTPLQGPASIPMTLYLSTTAGNEARVRELIQQMGWTEAHILVSENRGRDMAPFVLDLLPRVIAAGHPWLLKLHTKRSTHLEDGGVWSQHLQRSLSDVQDLAKHFTTDPALGLLTPAGTLMPSTVSLERNVTHLRWLLQALNIPSDWWLRQPFAAGSMYAVRSQALVPLLQLQLQRAQFEPEQGQQDGTLAHALERVVAALVVRQGLRLSELSGNAQAVPRFGYGWAAPV